MGLFMYSNNFLSHSHRKAPLLYFFLPKKHSVFKLLRWSTMDFTWLWRKTLRPGDQKRQAFRHASLPEQSRPALAWRSGLWPIGRDVYLPESAFDIEVSDRFYNDIKRIRLCFLQHVIEALNIFSRHQKWEPFLLTQWQALSIIWCSKNGNDRFLNRRINI